MQAIERNIDEVNKSPSLYSMTGDIKHVNTMMVNRHALSEVLAHIDKLEAEVERLKDLADSEGSRAVGYLRRARNAEAENERLNAIANSEGTRAAEYLRRARNVEDEAERLRKDAERYAALRLGQKWIVWMLLETRFDPKNLTLPSTQQ